MSLDISKIAQAIDAMVARLKAGLQQRRQHLDAALGVLGDETINLEQLKRKIAQSRTSWLVAGLVDSLSKRVVAPAAPADFTVMASDGSHIDVDRHRSARCFLINIGSAALSYGTDPDAILDSQPTLYSADEDLVITQAGPGGREQMIEGALLGIKRHAEEGRHLAEMAKGLPANRPALALIDGSLILWGLISMGYPEFVVEALLDNGFLKSLDEMKEIGRDKKLAVASYISFPRSTDVVNALRVAICPHEPVNCDQHCQNTPLGQRDCDAVAGVRDRDLFLEFLGDGERSPLFISSSSIVAKRYREHQVYFFYLRVDDEIARVELPQWVAMNEEKLNLAHSLILDQCRRGHGYPVALSEAHEQAVITGADREQFARLIEMSLVEEHLPATASAKSQSKRTRWL